MIEFCPLTLNEPQPRRICLLFCWYCYSNPSGLWLAHRNRAPNTSPTSKQGTRGGNGSLACASGLFAGLCQHRVSSIAGFSVGNLAAGASMTSVKDRIP